MIQSTLDVKAGPSTIALDIAPPELRIQRGDASVDVGGQQVQVRVQPTQILLDVTRPLVPLAPTGGVRVDLGAVAGPRGPEGPQGVQGVEGPPGPAGDGVMNFLHEQTTPADVWVITHNLGYRPAGIFVTDSAGTMHSPSVQHLSINALELSFVGAMTGTAHLS